MPAIDHLVYASPDLAEGIARIEALTRVRPQEGGVHPGVGTRNALVGLGDDCYLEVVGIDPDQPAPDFGRPFGIDDRQDPGLVAWAIHPTRGESLADVAGRLRASGFDPGEPVTMSRTTPAGEELNWRLTFPIAGVGALPFVIDWGDTESPARSA
ncbi:MAG: VOC family protein, partial [Acidimicrobiia bacterium]|nr:VOC family protein [Acidimicrobiia bacterium]